MAALADHPASRGRRAGLSLAAGASLVSGADDLGIAAAAQMLAHLLECVPNGAIAVLDTGLRYEAKQAGVHWVWRAGIDNLFDRRAWRESPYEFSHVYLYPLAPRTLRVSVQVEIQDP